MGKAKAARKPQSVDRHAVGYLLNLAGEYRVCSELLKRGIFATLTYGNAKCTDIYAMVEGRRSMVKIEVKTSRRPTFVTGISQKGLHKRGANTPDLWILYFVSASGNHFEERFFVLTHEEICRIQKKRNAAYARKYWKKHGARPNVAAGVDNVARIDLAAYEGRWDKVAHALKDA